MSEPLERRAEEWVAPWPNGRHLLRTRDWLLVLDPHAGLALRLAALGHDAERNFSGSPPQDPGLPANDRGYRDAHQARSAEVADRWLADQGAPRELRGAVSALIAVHEWGGSPQADLLQAADSISFLEVNADHAERWMLEHGHSAQRIATQLDWMYRRISIERARELAQPFYARARAMIESLERRSDAREAGDRPGA